MTLGHRESRSSLLQDGTPVQTRPDPRPQAGVLVLTHCCPNVLHMVQDCSLMKQEVMTDSEL